MTTKVEASRPEAQRRRDIRVRNTAIILVIVLGVGLPPLALAIESVASPVFQLAAGLIAGAVVGLAGRLGWRCAFPALAGGATAGVFALAEWTLAEDFYRVIVDDVFGQVDSLMALLLGVLVMLAVRIATFVVQITAIVTVTRRLGRMKLES